MGWTRALPEAAIPAGEVRPWERAGVHLALWRTRAGQVVACDARCPHQWSDLGIDGAVDGDELVCTAHHWRFDTTGAGWKDAVTGRRDPKAPVETHRCRVREGWVEVDLPDAGGAGGRGPNGSG